MILEGESVFFQNFLSQFYKSKPWFSLTAGELLLTGCNIEQPFIIICLSSSIHIDHEGTLLNIYNLTEIKYRT